LALSTTHDQRIGITSDRLCDKDFSFELFVQNLKHRCKIAVPREPFEDGFDHDEYDNKKGDDCYETEVMTAMGEETSQWGRETMRDNKRRWWRGEKTRRRDNKRLMTKMTRTDNDDGGGGKTTTVKGAMTAMGGDEAAGT
jgi:hypothetical protein